LIEFNQAVSKQHSLARLCDLPMLQTIVNFGTG